MDEGSKKLIEDCFLRPVADARATKNSSVENPPTKTPLKTELHVLRLNDESQKMVMETLRSIHGEDFQLKDSSRYKDRGSRLKKAYWQDRGTLIIQGGCDYSNVPKSDTDNESRFRRFAIMKLESYGFPQSHCTEALEHCKGNIDEALELLFAKYFQVVERSNAASEHSENELLELREDEKLALQSIYENSFEEKEKNHVWSLKFKVDHLLAHSPSQQKKLEMASKVSLIKPHVKRKERCRNFAKGHCRFGEKCRFSHEVEEQKEKAATIDNDPNLDPNWFYLEVRFPKGTQYPYEAPLVFLKTTCHDIPQDVCLRLTRKLFRESQQLAQDGMPCVYTISEILQMEEQIAQTLAEDQDGFLDPNRSLFYVPKANEVKDKKSAEPLPTHYQKGSTGQSERSNISRAKILEDDRGLAKKFMGKQGNQHYKNMVEKRKKLPAWNKMTQILDTIAQHRVVVISGETGCGKSTQVPQFILDDWMFQASKLEKGEEMPHVEVICTQPRRLSAIGVASRVADERDERVGSVVGYQIRLENKISLTTRLTFCTTGILLRRLQSDPMLESVTHVIVDEVHERSEESDFLLLILKEILQKRNDLKVILMSATLNAALFSSYFGGVPILEIPGRTFPVEQLFLEDILDKTGFVLEADSQFSRKMKKKEEQELINELEYADVRAANEAPPKSIRDENLNMSSIYARYSDYSKTTCKTLFLLDPMRINPELIEAILRFIVEGIHEWPRKGSILIFLPGLAEIKTVYDGLCDSSVFSPRHGNFILVPLHSTLTNEEQALVFKNAPPGKRKIVLSTNIAETSVTIDDCVFVIDCGLMKEKRFDANKNMESLDLVWESRANAMQRKGRAGRVMPGVCIHLFTGHRFSNHFLSQPVPEIHRVPLEQLLMRIKTLPNFQNRNVADVIGNTLEPPTDENITSAIARLQDVGAFDEAENLTALGLHLSELPVDVRIGKLMLFGAIFQCVDSILTIAACLSHKSPFVCPFGKKNEADSKKKEFAICNSDHLTVLKAYKRWLEVNTRSKYAGKCYADENYLSWKTLETIIELKHQFLELLVSIGFVNVDVPKKKKLSNDNIYQLTGELWNINGENNRLLTALLCAALYPNVVKVLTPEMSFTMTAGGAMPRQPQASDLRFKTREDGYVSIHPSSVNHKMGSFLSPYLVYQEKVKTSKIFIRECTMVPLLPLVFFSGNDLKIELHSGDFIAVLDGGWIMLKAHNHETAEMVQCLREELIKILEEKIQDPCLNLLNHENGRKIIATIVYLISRQ